MAQYVVPLHEIRSEIKVSNSRFIATLAPAFSVEEARAFILRIRQEFADASHNVPAYLIGGSTSVIEHCSDDGEPSGTAGRPALTVLKGSGLGDVAVVVTRYFGGTKLGTGGLVRAYTEAVQKIVEIVERAERVPMLNFMIDLPYNWLERLRRLIAVHHGQVLDEEFAATITLTARLPLENYPNFINSLRQISNNTLSAVAIGEEVILAPVKS